MTAYNPAAHYEIKVWDVDFRSAPGGRALKARVYQPQGPGPFRGAPRSGRWLPGRKPV